MESRRTRNALLLAALAMAGLAVSLVILSVHRNIAASGGQYGSFCDVNEAVNCNVVLSSPQAYFLGLPVAVWGALSYVLLGGLAIGIMRATRYSARLRLAQLALVLSGWALAFSFYMAYVALVVINAVCLMCTALYATNAIAAAVAWLLYAGVLGERRARGARAPDGRGRAVLGGAAGVAALAVAVAVWKGLGGYDPGATVRDIANQNPEFYQWYTAQPVKTVTPNGGRSRGLAEAPITIVEFSDFQCGHCAQAYRVLKQVLPRYTSEVRVVFRHFPLDSACNEALQGGLHHDACAAAVAAECAGEQDRFWEYHDRLFDNQDDLRPESLRRYAGEVGLDAEAFGSCLESDRARATVERDVREGARLGIESTPTFFVNGRTIKGSLAPELFRYAIAIERAREHVPRGDVS